MLHRIERKRQRSWVNPYRARLRDFPGKLFSGEQVDEEKEVMAAVLTAAPRIFCEIGSGSGGHLLDFAQREVMALHVGFELRYKRCVRTLEKAQARGLENLMVLQAPGRYMPLLLREESVSGIFVNFPDPWIKNRWRKHRVLSRRFLNETWPLLVPEGFISVKTDNAEYFEEFLSFVNEDERFSIAEITRDLAQSDYNGQNIETEFETLFRTKGKSISYVLLKKDKESNDA